MSGRDLYIISGSPPCWTVMLALEVKGLPYRLRRLDNAKREQKSPTYLAVNPRGQVPTLVDGTVKVAETLAILAYLDASIPAPPLFGTSPVSTARIWQTICECDGGLRRDVGDISRPLFRGKGAEFEEQITAAAGRARAELDIFENRLGNEAWLAGGELSAADLSVFPVLMQLARAAGREEAKAFDLGVYPFDRYYPHLAEWCRRVEALPGYENAYPPHWK